jgi:hypothetical protein
MEGNKMEMDMWQIRFVWFPIGVLIKTLICAVTIAGGLALYRTSGTLFAFNWKRVCSFFLLIFGIYQTINLWFFFRM